MPLPPLSGEDRTSTALNAPGPSTPSPSICPPSPAAVETPNSPSSMASLLAKFPMPKSLPTGSPLPMVAVAESLLVLKQAFPTMELQPELAWHFLQDMSEADLRQAVVDVIVHQAEIYPSTPWIAILRTARQRFCQTCGGTGKTESETGYEMRCACRRR